MKAGLQFCFDKQSFSGDDFIRFYKEFVKFEPDNIIINGKIQIWDQKKHLKLISASDENENIIIGGKDFACYRTTITSSNKIPHRSIRIEQDYESFWGQESILLSEIENPQFVSAYFYNYEYETIQSEVFSNNLKGISFSEEIQNSIRNTPYKSEMWGGKEYEVKFNPGRSILIAKTWLMVGWKMWFGKPFFDLVSKEKIMSFPYAVKIEEINHNIVFVQLYEKIEEPYTPDAVFRQWKWREWLQFDELEEHMG